MREAGHFSKNLKITVNKEKKERGNDNKCLSNIGAKSNSSVPEPLRFSTNEIGSTSGKSGDTLQLSITSDN